MEYENRMKLEFDSRSANESFARVAVAAFLSQLNPTLEEVAGRTLRLHRSGQPENISLGKGKPRAH